jgi:23S rRNA pseudouridine2605 synthase
MLSGLSRFIVYAAECRSRGQAPQSESFALSSTPQFNVEQLAAARSERWHQGGDALLTLEAAREWVSELGIVLFAPRAHQLPTPAPSLVEATLGSAVSAPTALESEAARELVARMVADGSALPLNLLGAPGDAPDFVVSSQAFSYVFTLRGDKNWKQPPTTSGSVKVSPLALKVYEALAAGNALTAGELVTELGREVTENAIARALGELWMQLRVIPLLQQDGGATMWELTSRRFTKQIKAGANAGQPTALSAAISFYLAQAYAATEEEIETFLSPLAPRSKVRDVLHGLTAARQLENAVLEGKTLLYIPGGLPEFPEVVAAEPVVDVADFAATAVLGAVVSERIRKFDRPRAPREQRGERPARSEGGERAARPFRKTGEGRGGPRKPFGEKRYERGEGRGFPERERRPFQRDRAEGEKPSFTRPWDEERKPRPRREEGERPAGKRPYRRDEEGRGGEKRESRGGPRGAVRGKSAQDRGPRQERPFRPRREGEREGSGSRPPKTFRPRREGEREGFESRPKKPFRPSREGGREGFESRPPKPFRPRREGGEGFESRPAKTFRPRREGEREGFASRPSKPYRPRREGEREGFASRPQKPFRRREEGGREGGEKRPFRAREEGRRDDRKPGAKRGGKPGFAGKKFGGEKKFSGERKFSGGKPSFGGKPKSGSRTRDVRAKDMRSKSKGEKARGEQRPRRETEE